jgi:hypothetical protein
VRLVRNNTTNNSRFNSDRVRHADIQSINIFGTFLGTRAGRFEGYVHAANICEKKDVSFFRNA